MAVQTHPALTRVRRDASLPVLMKEMRSRMRGTRMQALLFIATAIAIAVGLLILSAQWDDAIGGPGEYGYRTAEIGKSLFVGLLILEAILCALVAPALTAGSISLEREHQTLDLLLLTPLSSANIVFGKYLSSLSYLALLLFCALPVGGLAFLFGGVDPGTIFWSILLLLSVIAVFGAIGIYCSASNPRTSSAVVVSYGLCIAWLGFMPALLGFGFFLCANPLDASCTLAYSMYFIFGMAIASLMLAVPLTTLITVVLSVIARRPMPRLFNIICLLALGAVVFLLMQTCPEQIVDFGNTYGEVLLVGNPVVALYSLIEGSVGGAMFSSSTILEKLFYPLTIALQFLGAWVYLMLAAGAVQRLRTDRKT